MLVAKVFAEAWETQLMTTHKASTAVTAVLMEATPVDFMDKMVIHAVAVAAATEEVAAATVVVAAAATAEVAAAAAATVEVRAAIN